MSLSSYSVLCILLLALSITIVQTQFWGTSTGRCWGQYEQYRECASTCPDTCDDIRWPNPAKMCTLMCRMGCDCMQPFVRLNRNPMSPCVHPRQCPMMGYNYRRKW